MRAPGARDARNSSTSASSINCVVPGPPPTNSISSAGASFKARFGNMRTFASVVTGASDLPRTCTCAERTRANTSAGDAKSELVMPSKIEHADREARAGARLSGKFGLCGRLFTGGGSLLASLLRPGLRQHGRRNRKPKGLGKSIACPFRNLSFNRGVSGYSRDAKREVQHAAYLGPCATIRACCNSQERPIPRSFELASRESSRAACSAADTSTRSCSTYLADRTIRGEVPKEFDISVRRVRQDQGRQRRAGRADARAHLQAARTTRLVLRGCRQERLVAARDSERHVTDLWRLSRMTRPRSRTTRPPWRLVRTAGLTTRYAVAGVLITLVLSVAANVVLLASRAPTNERLVADSHVWAGLNATSRPLLIVIGDHFFFGEWGSRLRTRDIRINSKDDLQAAAEYAANPGLSFETLSYLPRARSSLCKRCCRTRPPPAKRDR